jgi:hypothetical protein
MAVFHYNGTTRVPARSMSVPSALVGKIHALEVQYERANERTRMRTPGGIHSTVSPVILRC